MPAQSSYHRCPILKLITQNGALVDNARHHRRPSRRPHKPHGAATPTNLPMPCGGMHGTACGRRQSRWRPLRLTALLYLGCPTAQHAARLLQRNVKFAAAQHSLCSVSRAFWCYASQQGMGKASCLSVCFLTSLPLGLA